MKVLSFTANEKRNRRVTVGNVTCIFNKVEVLFISIFCLISSVICSTYEDILLWLLFFKFKIIFLSKRQTKLNKLQIPYWAIKKRIIKTFENRNISSNVFRTKKGGIIPFVISKKLSNDTKLDMPVHHLLRKKLNWVNGRRIKFSIIVKLF